MGYHIQGDAMFGLKSKISLPTDDQALPGREHAIVVPGKHFVTDRSLSPPYPDGYEQALFGLGCFWGAERQFWQTPGVHVTAVGYTAGYTPNPTYEEVCSGRTGHTEAVHVVYDPGQISYSGLLKVFWESHNPSQGMRQGNDVGTQYRSGIYTYDEAQQVEAEQSRKAYQRRLKAAGYGDITTEIRAATGFYYAEDYHQQYLAKNPGGYCGLGGTGVSCATGMSSVV
jgi:peptide-methionine (S)-S-oxide reductase